MGRVQRDDKQRQSTVGTQRALPSCCPSGGNCRCVEQQCAGGCRISSATMWPTQYHSFPIRASWASMAQVSNKPARIMRADHTLVQICRTRQEQPPNTSCRAACVGLGTYSNTLFILGGYGGDVQGESHIILFSLKKTKAPDHTAECAVRSFEAAVG